MPYITETRKAEIDRELQLRTNPVIQNTIRLFSVGDLNYLVSTLMSMWLQNDFTYNELNATIGVLECAKQELYRRIIAPYEEAKIMDNGDVFDINMKEPKNEQG